MSKLISSCAFAQALLLLSSCIHIGSSGQVSFPNLDDGHYSLRLVARAGTSERTVVRRILTVNTDGSACGAHLINDGVTVNGGRATVEFSSSGLQVSEFQCSLDNAPPDICKCICFVGAIGK